MPEKRNIVLITLDSLRADHCSFMGYERKTTPTIDKMAKGGLYFENAIASGVATGPSMMGVFTGDYALIESWEYSGKPWRDSLRSRKTLAEGLVRKGYNTVCINTNPFTSKYFGFEKGFNQFIDMAEEKRSKSLGNSSRLQKFYLNFKKIVQKSDTLMKWEGLYEQIVQSIYKTEEPFFVWIILLDTHFPYFPPKNFRIWNNPNFFHLLYLYWKLEKEEWKHRGRIKQIINAYDNEIYYADKFINSLWRDINNKNPVFIIHGDHGDGLGEHEFYHHPPMLYEELIHVPLIIYNANIKGKIEEPASLKCLPATIFELINEKNEFPSKSLLQGGDEWVISKVFHRGERKVTIRMKGWKFITGQKDEDELYNLRKDPYEQENLLNEQPNLAKEMKKIVESHVKHEKEKRRIGERISKLKIRQFI